MKRRSFFKTVGMGILGLLGLSTRGKAAEACKPTDEACSLTERSLTCSVDNYKLPLFELTTEDGHKYELYLNGQCKGFPKGTVVINRAFPLFMMLEAQQHLASQKAFSSPK